MWARCHFAGLASAIDWMTWSSGESGAVRRSVSALTVRKAESQPSRGGGGGRGGSGCTGARRMRRRRGGGFFSRVVLLPRNGGRGEGGGPHRPANPAVP